MKKIKKSNHHENKKKFDGLNYLAKSKSPILDKSKS